MLTFVFPGQGSQKPAMGAPWRSHESWSLVAEAGEIVGRDVAHLLLDAGAEELRATRNAQLATFTLSMVVLDAVERTGLEPALMAGHSLGEYSALVAAGVVSFEDGVQLVAERGEAMQDAADDVTSTMAAVLGLDDDQVEIACARVDDDVWVANYNAPGQVVIAGTPDAIAAATDVAKELGAKRVLPVEVSGAFHTPLMAPARDRLRKALAATDFRDSDVPVVANVDATPHTQAADWPSLLSAQLISPVRWRQGLHELQQKGASLFVEIGPGTVLTGTVKRTLRDAGRVDVSTPGDLDTLLATVAETPPTTAVDLPGEPLYAHERLVVSPAAGVFEPAAEVSPGCEIQPGTLVGAVGGTEVRSPFGGTFMGMLAMAGERLARSQPVAWLRTA